MSTHSQFLLKIYLYFIQYFKVCRFHPFEIKTYICTFVEKFVIFCVTLHNSPVGNNIQGCDTSANEKPMQA